MRLLYTIAFSAFFILLSFFSSGQEVQSATLVYTPAENGFVLNIPFKWKFINCYGEVHVTITKNSPEITSSTYIYNGKRYTAADLGAEAFAKPECGLTDITADFYNGSFRLGNVTMGNVIDWFGGCFGQTYHLTKQLGLNDADYKEKLASLSLSNLQLKTCSSRDYKLEGKIQEIEKQNKAKDAMSRADSEYASGDYEKARESYIEALKFDSTNEHAKKRLEEIKEKLEAQKDKKAYEEHMKKAEEAMKKGDYETAKSELSKALQKQPGDKAAQSKLDELNKKLEEEAKAKEVKSAAVAEASGRSHKGSFWGRNFHSDSYGSATQAANLIGNFRLDYDIWTTGGEPAFRYRFYWEWDDALNTGMPQWVSVLHDTVVMVADVKKYPDLYARWNAIRPLYIEVECDILYYKYNDEFVTDEGKIHVIVPYIGKSGQEVDWSLPSSCAWDELFPYCNRLDWGYFRKIGLYEEIDAYADEFGSDVAWPKYSFEYSNNINFYTGHNWFHSYFKELSSKDYENSSSSADIVKVVWPVEEIQAVIREFEEREDGKKEEKMSAEDFWNSPEKDKTTKGSADDFWNTPENTMTKTEKKAIDTYNSEVAAANSGMERLNQFKSRYEELQKPMNVTSAKSVKSPNYILTGKVSDVFAKRVVKISGLDEPIFADVNNDGTYRAEIKLKTGSNKLTLELMSTRKSKTALKSENIAITFVPELDGEGTVSRRDVKITVYDDNSVQDDYYDLYVNGKFVDYVHNAPGGRTTVNYTLDEGDNFIELRLSREMGKSTALVIIINDGEFKKSFSGSKDHKYVISAPYEE